MSGEDDRELIQRCLGNEPGAWRLLVDRHAPTVKALARRFWSRAGHFAAEADVEDVVQEVFFALTRKDFRLLRNYDAAYSFKTYLGVLTRTQVHRALRRRNPRPDSGELESRAAAETPDAAETAEEREALAAALSELEPRDSEILRLRYLKEMDYRSIARTLEIAETSVGQLLYRAKKRLLDRLKHLLGLLV